MSRFHISQDETGFWQMSFEDDQGKLSLVSHQFTSPDHLIEDAHEMVASGDFANATVVVAPPRPVGAAAATLEALHEYKRPAPRKAIG
jgi:hypothetical protein